MYTPGAQPPTTPVLRTLAEVQEEHVARVFDHAGGNKSRAARILGISRPALDRKLSRITGMKGASSGVS